jgi:hypothetical protein
VPRYEVGDVLVLQEYNPTGEVYTGRELRRTVTYKTVASKLVPVPDGWCVLGIREENAQIGVVPDDQVDADVKTVTREHRVGCTASVNKYSACTCGAFEDAACAVYLVQGFALFKDGVMLAIYPERANVPSVPGASVKPVRVSRISWKGIP